MKLDMADVHARVSLISEVFEAFRLAGAMVAITIQ